MALFVYTAANSDGKIESSQMEAVDRDTVISHLKDKKLLVISVKEENQKLSKNFTNKVTALDRINLANNLAVMLKAGVGISEALEVSAKDSKSTYFKKVCADISFSLENGRQLSDGLAQFPNDFDDVFISLVKAGEASGKLEEVLIQLSLQLKKDYSLTSKIKSAFAYPLVLVCGLIAVVIMLMTFVLPKLVSLFESSNLKLPLSTRMIFAISRLLSAKPYISLTVILFLAVILILILRKRKVQKFFIRILFRLPIFANLIRQIELSRFTRTLGNLLQSGVPIVKAIEITSEAMSIPIFKKTASEVKENVAKGVSLSNAFKGNKNIFPEMLISVMRVGEKSGNLDQLLFGLSDFFTEQVDNTLNNLAGLVEPVLLIIVGLAIGGMAVSIILPIYQLIGSF